MAVVSMSNCDWISFDALSLAALDVELCFKPAPLLVKRSIVAAIVVASLVVIVRANISARWEVHADFDDRRIPGALADCTFKQEAERLSRTPPLNEEWLEFLFQSVGEIARHGKQGFDLLHETLFPPRR